MGGAGRARQFLDGRRQGLARHVAWGSRALARRSPNHAAPPTAWVAMDQGPEGRVWSVAEAKTPSEGVELMAEVKLPREEHAAWAQEARLSGREDLDLGRAL